MFYQLLPVSSLPSRYGIGCFSKEAYKFIDRLKVKASECVFIDDNLANVQAAFTLGFVGIRMKESVGTLIRSLATCNVALR